MFTCCLSKAQNITLLYYIGNQVNFFLQRKSFSIKEICMGIVYIGYWKKNDIMYV